MTRHPAQRRRRRGFTLFELLIVVVMIGVMAGLVAGRLAGSSRLARQQDALRSLTTMLAEARVQAMRRTETETVELHAPRGADTLTATWRTRTRDWEQLQLQPVNDLNERLEHLTARFDPEGRTRQRLWRFMAADSPGTIWTITFDPVSGAPEFGRSADAAPRTRHQG